MDRRLVRSSRGVAVFAAALLGAALLVQLPAVAQTATRAKAGDLPGNPNHPVRHDCLRKSCADVQLVEPICLSGECNTIDDGQRFMKCYPVEYESSCHESAGNGPAVTCGPYECTINTNGDPTTRRCGFYSLNPCGPDPTPFPD